MVLADNLSFFPSGISSDRRSDWAFCVARAAGHAASHIWARSCRDSASVGGAVMITLDGSKTTTATTGWLASMARERLRESGHAELTVLDCDEYDGVLRLRGTLSSSHSLQHALA